MNKIISHCFAIIGSFVLIGSASSQAFSLTSPSFRINMAKSYGAHTPAKPAPPFPAAEWVDVGNWQTFLVAKGFLAAGKFAPNTFDAATEAATKKFQAAKAKIVPGAKLPTLPPTGVVNWATYHKAVREGMPKYPPVVTAPPPHAHHPPKHHHTSLVVPIPTDSTLSQN